MPFYYLANSLTPLEFGDVPDLSFLELLEKYEPNITKSQKNGFQVIRLYFDLENIKKLLTSRSTPVDLDPRANLSKKELKQAVENKEFFPLYVHDFLAQHQANKEISIHFPTLLSSYFIHEGERVSGFLKEYLAFERQWRLILTAFRAKKLKRNLVKEFSFEDAKDPIVEMILSQRDSPYFETPPGYEELQEMLLTSKDKPLYQYKHLAEFRFKKLREMSRDKPFSIDYLMSYTLRVGILEDLRSLNNIKGQEILNSILKDKA